MKKRKPRPLRLIAIVAILFIAGVTLGVSYRWYEWSIFPMPFFVTAADNAAPSEGAPPPPPSDILAQNAPAAPSSVPSSVWTPDIFSKVPAIQPATPAPTPARNANVVVLNPVQPPAPQPPPPGGNSLMLPQVPQSHPVDTLPVIGDAGQTIWVPRAIEGCWQGSGGSSLEYLGGCPNMVSGRTTPIKLRWCFRRFGNQPLTLTMAHGHYGGRVSQRWDVTGAHGQTIELRETISYMTMMFLHVVDVGHWTCRITGAGQLQCDEHELARCGPGPWLQPPWFRGSGWVTAQRAGR
jgi:hypothetical protein